MTGYLERIENRGPVGIKIFCLSPDLCPLFVKYSTSELNIYLLTRSVLTHDAFNIAGPHSIQNVCRI